jgi:hypothetical protein
MYPAEEIRDELAALGSVLADQPRRLPYAVPEGYFGQLESNLRTVLQYERDPQPGWPRLMPYQMPEAYFETLPEQVLALAKDSVPAAIPAAKTPFGTPEGYFEQLPQQLMERIRTMEPQEQPATRVIPLRRRQLVRTVQLAAAALLLAVAGIWMFRQTLPQQTGVEQQLAALSKDTIRDYLVAHVDELEADELITLAPATMGFPSGDGLPASREDIIRYLDETGWDTRLN